MTRAACPHSALIVALVLTACGAQDQPTGTPLDSRSVAGVIFLTQNAVPAITMDALLIEIVSRDRVGCLRAQTADRHTIIWPKDFSLHADGAALHVRDAEGREVGRIGESFALGGGELVTLHDGIQMSDADRRLAHDRCPGRYWLVGTVVERP